jgi:hypothetical protein
VAETNGLLNRRTGKSGTEGSNPSVSAIIAINSARVRYFRVRTPGRLKSLEFSSIQSA